MPRCLKPSFRGLLPGVALILAALPGCAGNANVTATDPAALRRYPRVAVLAIKSTVLRSDGAIMASVQRGVDMADQLVRSAGDALDGNQSPPPATRPNSQTDQPLAATYRTLAGEVSVRNFLELGFAPIERAAIDQILKEQALGESGILSTTERREIGQLLRADALFFGELQIQINQGLLSEEVLLHFTGRLVSVDEGLILASGESRREASTLSAVEVQGVIDDYFARVPDLREGCL